MNPAIEEAMPDPDRRDDALLRMLCRVYRADGELVDGRIQRPPTGALNDGDKLVLKALSHGLTIGEASEVLGVPLEEQPARRRERGPARTDPMKVVRIADGELPRNPGEISKCPVEGQLPDGEVVHQVMWFFVPPTGGGVHQIGAKPLGGGHQIDEDEDGAITIAPFPTPDNSNSILVHPRGKFSGWHGYIQDGEWRTC